MAELYGVSVKTANEHLINIYEEGELPSEATKTTQVMLLSQNTRKMRKKYITTALFYLIKQRLHKLIGIKNR